MMILQPVAEFVVLLGFGTILVLFGLMLFINPTMLWKWDQIWLTKYRGWKKTKKPPVTYVGRQRMGAIITMGFGITLLVAAMFTVLIYKPF